jgi:hypothetical protein
VKPLAKVADCTTLNEPEATPPVTVQKTVVWSTIFELPVMLQDVSDVL